MRSSFVATAVVVVAPSLSSCAAPPPDVFMSAEAIAAVPADSLFVGEGEGDTIERFDTSTGKHLGTFVMAKPHALHGPRGLVFNRTSPTEVGNLLVANQNVHRSIGGEIIEYRGNTGDFLFDLVPRTEPGAPFAPRGMVLGQDGILYVTDVDHGESHPIVHDARGRIARYDGITGTSRGDLPDPGTTASPDYFPRSAVVGPDGLLYVSSRNRGRNGGQILRFDPTTGAFLGVFIEGNGANGTSVDFDCGGTAAELNRPEGLVFDPDGLLYVTSFLTGAFPDQILVFRGQACVDHIDLDSPGEPRAFAQALLFGPGRRLFVPITGPGPQVTHTPRDAFTGEVRSYDVSTHAFDVFVPPFQEGGPLAQPWYLTFCNTDPATLAYGDGPCTLP